MFGALRDGSSDPDAMDTSPSGPITKKLPFKPSLAKKPSLSKSPSVTSLKKGASLTLPIKKISKPRKTLTAEERKKQKQLLKSKSENLPNLMSENVSINNLIRNQLSWTPWQLVISPNEADKMENGELRVDTKNAKDCKSCQLFEETNVPALYEFSMQTCREKNVFYSTFCSVFAESWYAPLLAGESIKAQIDNVLSIGYSVFIRRAVLRSESNNHSNDMAAHDGSYVCKDQDEKKSLNHP